jgi:histidinol-phosphate aminotransferase
MTDLDMTRVIRAEVIRQKAYSVETLFCPVKLDANENPFPFPGRLKRQLLRRLATIAPARYPEPGSSRLNRRLADALGVAADMVITGNGSDELIAILCAATGGEGAQTMILGPSFAMYRISAINHGHKVIEVPLDENFEIDPAAIQGEIDRSSPRLFFIGYPNNPTGNCFRPDLIEEIIRTFPGIVVVDEAYYHFSGKTMLTLLDRFDNLVILRSLSKVGLAAFRVGFLLARPSLAEQLNKVRLPYNLNAFSQVAAEFFLDEEEAFLAQIKRIIRLRNDLYGKLLAMPFITAFPTEANFIFFRCQKEADRIYEALVEKGVLLRNLNSPGPLAGGLRVSVGKKEENDIFLQALREAVSL